MGMGCLGGDRGTEHLAFGASQRGEERRGSSCQGAGNKAGDGDRSWWGREDSVPGSPRGQRTIAGTQWVRGKARQVRTALRGGESTRESPGLVKTVAEWSGGLREVSVDRGEME